MQNALTAEVADELNETSKTAFEEARGRLLARIILASPVGNSDEVAAFASTVIANLAESNQMIGYFEAINLWSEELRSMPQITSKVQGIEERLLKVTATFEDQFMAITLALHMDAENTRLMQERFDTFKEASKRLGYSEVAQMYVADQKK